MTKALARLSFVRALGTKSRRWLGPGPVGEGAEPGEVSARTAVAGRYPDADGVTGRTLASLANRSVAETTERMRWPRAE